MPLRFLEGRVHLFDRRHVDLLPGEELAAALALGGILEKGLQNWLPSCDVPEVY